MLERLEQNRRREKNGELAELMGEVSRRLAKYAPGEHVLTDDRAPVELLGMGMIDDLIMSEVSYYRDIFKKEGFRGLLENF